MIGFTAPWALLGLAAAAIPLLLHLFARRVPPTVVFPATRYLAETARAQHRRLTLQHWLLLLVRTLLLTALVLAAAGPTLPSSRVAAHAPVALTLILDNSLSSGAVSGGTRVLEPLRRAALEIVAALGAEDQVWLITADGTPRRGRPDELRQMIARLAPTEERLDLGSAVAAAREATAGQRLRTTVVVLSDLQRSALSGARGQGPLVVIRPEGAAVPNLGIAAVAAGRQPWGPEGGRITVSLTGPPSKSAAVALKIGARPPRQQLGYGGAVLSFNSGGLPPGWWPLRVELEPDELRLDDARSSAVRVVNAARVSWSASDRFLATACEVLAQNGRLVRGSDVSVGELGPGASIVQPPEDPARLGALNRALAARGANWHYGELAPGSGVTDSGPLFGRHELLRRYTLVANQGGPVQGVLFTAGGAPWVVRANPGNLILLGSRLEPSWSELPVSAEFVPFIDFLANRAVRGELVSLEAAPGDPVLLPDAATAVAYEDKRQGVEGGAPFRARETGLHFILAGHDTIGVLAVNPDPRESQLARATDAEVRRLWAGARLVAPRQAAGAALAAGGRAELRGLLLGVAALLALADGLLAGARARPLRRAA